MTVIKIDKVALAPTDELSDGDIMPEQVDTLADFAERLDLGSGEDELGALLLSQTRALSQPAAVALLLVEPETSEFVITQTLPQRSLNRWEVEVEAQIAAGTFAWGINQRQPVLLPLRAAEAPLPSAHSVVLVPLVARYQLLGVLLVATTWTLETLPGTLARRLAVLAKQYTLTLGMHRLIANLQRRNRDLALTSAELTEKVTELEEARAALQRAMVAQARKTDELERLKIELELKVEERTADLRSANQQLERLSRTDGLTGLLNRRSFEERLADEESRRQRTGRPTTVVIIDLNGLKRINDQQGHAVGDAALLATATLLRASARRTDVVARLGGDEFGLLLIETGEAGARMWSDRLATAARVAHWREGHADGLSLAVGIASCPPAATLQEAVGLADGRMYIEKRAHYAALANASTAKGTLIAREGEA